MNINVCRNIVIALFVCSFAFVSKVNAQFNYVFVADSVIVLNNDCEAVFNLDPNPPVFAFSTIPAVTIVSFEIDTLLTGYNYGNVLSGVSTFSLAYIAVNSLGLIDTSYYNIYVEDQTPPTILNFPNDTTISCLATLGLPIIDVDIVGDDNCDSNPVITYLGENLEQTICTGSTNISRKWAVTDSENNSQQFTQNIQVVDTIPPIFINVPNDTTGVCGDNLSIPLLGQNGFDLYDECGTIFSLQIIESDKVCIDDNVTFTRTWTANDACGNETSVSHVVTLLDTIPPTFDVPNNVAISCESFNVDTIIGVPTNIMDGCDDMPTVSHTDNIMANGCANNFIIQRTWSLTDDCGNIATAVQEIVVQDTTKPVFVIEPQDTFLACTNNELISIKFQEWLNQNAAAVAEDNCDSESELSWFSFNDGTLDQPSIDLDNCGNYGQGIYAQQKVDFLVVDKCSNQSVLKSATFYVQDTVAPILLCPSDTMIFTAPNACDNSYEINPPIYFDACNGIDSFISIDAENQPYSVFSLTPGDTSVLVEPVAINFSTPLSQDLFAVQDPIMQILVSNVDGNGALEYFNVLDENGQLIGQTNASIGGGNPPGMCGTSLTSFTISADQFNYWAQDGLISFSLLPNQPSLNNLPDSLGINDLCNNTEVVASINYLSSQSGSVTNYQYKINQGPFIVAPSMGTNTEVLSQGINEILLSIEDCSGNVGSCTFEVTVEDNEDPTIDCPSDIVLDVTTSCDTIVSIGLPDDYQDNCSFNAGYNLASPISQMTFSQYGTHGFISDDISNMFINCPMPALDFAKLTIYIHGDINTTGEFFEVYAEGELLNQTIHALNPTNGRTGLGIGCNNIGFETFDFYIPKDSLNNWVNLDGNINVEVVPNRDTTNFTQFVSPCVSFVPGTPDGSMGPNGENEIYFSLEYDFATIEYYIVDNVVDTLEVPTTTLAAPQIEDEILLEVGQYDLYYIVSDASGNKDTCVSLINVNDAQDPIALCDTLEVFVSPDGSSLSFSDADTLDLNSSDNCSTLSFSTNTIMFDCTDVGLDTIVELNVTDESGNTSTCGALVKVRMQPFTPSFQLGLCLNDTVQFLANPPLGNYSFIWKTPTGAVFSNDENPILVNLDASDSGVYTVQITGDTGCTAEEGIYVEIMSTSNTPDIAISTDTICQGETVVLATNEITGNNVLYNWHQVNPSNVLTIISTIEPNFTPNINFIGDYEYYLRVQLDGCNSASSTSVFLNVKPTPNSTVNDQILFLCEGDSLHLGTPIVGTNIEYSWENPEGVEISNLQNPLPFEVTNVDQSGGYSLTTMLNGCFSNPSTTEVLVSEVPSTPNIISPGLVCEGDTLTLTTDVSNADVYYWVNPQNDTILSVQNELFLNNVSALDDGWYVFVTNNNCLSSNSDLFQDFLVPSPLAIMQTPTSVCSGDSIELVASFEPNTIFTWTTPSMVTHVGETVMVLAEDGTYCLSATNNQGCETENCSDVTLLNTPTITSISQDGNNCVDGDDDIQFIPTLFPLDVGNYAYEWNGPNFASLDNTALLVDVEESQNGYYYLVVSDGVCVSDSFGIDLEVYDIPTIVGELILMNEDTSLCVGDDLILSVMASPIAGIQYIWTGPNYIDTTDVPQVVLNNMTLNNSGTYYVTLDNKGCLSTPSNEIQIEVFNYPAIPSISAMSPICENDAINLELNTTYTNTQYNWFGPNFNSNLIEPTIQMAQLDNEGIYSLFVEQNGCITYAADSLEILVSPQLDVPIISVNSPLCFDDFEGLELVIDENTFSYDAVYTWTTNLGDTLGVLQDDTLNVFDQTHLAAGTYTISVNGFRENCIIDSDEITLVIDSIPSEGVVLCNDNIVICPEDDLQLCASQNQLGTGGWHQIILDDEPIMDINNPNNFEAFVEGVAPGFSYAFEYTLANDGCGIYSRDTVFVESSGLFETADAGHDLELCQATTFTLNGVLPSGNVEGVWTQPVGQEDQGISIINPENSSTNVTGLMEDIVYEFYWNVENLDCPEFTADTIVVSNYSIPNIESFAGADLITCTPEITLNATNPSVGSGHWISLGDDAIIDDILLSNTLVSNLTPGVNKFLWVLDNGACIDYSSDLVNIFYLESSVAMDDSYVINESGQFNFNVLNNDALSGEFAFSFTQPEHGHLNSSTPGQFGYVPPSTFIGEDSFTYLVCSEECPEECSEATVTISVEASTDCGIPSIFTPNEDGINDRFIIPCLESGQYQESEVTILNQWGDVVFYAAPYNNDWDGTKDNIDLPVSTYFYVIKFSNDIPSENGFIMLER